MPRCYLALWAGAPVAFCATVSLIGQKNRWRISRIVTLPDYQGIGVGTAVAEAVAELHVQEGHRVNVTGSHPALIAHCRRSPRWKTVGVKKTGSHGATIHPQLPRLARPGRGVVRICGKLRAGKSGLLGPAQIMERGRLKRARGHRPKVGRRSRTLEVFHNRPRNQ